MTEGSLVGRVLGPLSDALRELVVAVDVSVARWGFVALLVLLIGWIAFRPGEGHDPKTGVRRPFYRDLRFWGGLIMAVQAGLYLWFG